MYKIFNTYQPRTNPVSTPTQTRLPSIKCSRAIILKTANNPKSNNITIAQIFKPNDYKTTNAKFLKNSKNH